MTTKKKAVVICPGRGTYSKETLGYLKARSQTSKEFITTMDRWREAGGEIKISELDNAKAYNAVTHTKGENAASLIYACAYADFLEIDRNEFEIIAITGNSMGWYIAAACANSLSPESAYRVIQTMGSQMRDGLIGGQVIYSLVDENWKPDSSRINGMLSVVDRINNSGDGRVYDSIYLGGYIVFGGDDRGVKRLLEELPKVDERFPFKLVNHAAFHTELLRETSEQALVDLPVELFSAPEIPLIDGRGHIWTPKNTDVVALHEYTLGHQVYQAYDFTAAMTVAIREFAPEALILLGPGDSLGGSIGQILVQLSWQGIDSKSAFAKRQSENTLLYSLGRTA